MTISKLNTKAKNTLVATRRRRDDANGKLLKPLLPWYGGKRRCFLKIREKIQEIHPDEIAGYLVLPFGGMAAVGLGLRPKRLRINDINGRVQNYFQVVRDDCDDLIRLLRWYSESPEWKPSKEGFKAMKHRLNTEALSPLEEAATFHYLVKLGGAYAENMKGKFNVTFKRVLRICDEAAIRSVSDYFKEAEHVEFTAKDFREVLRDVTKDDFVYADPPYIHTLNEYTATGFSLADQQCLVSMLRSLPCSFLMSNKPDPGYIALLPDEFDKTTFYAQRPIDNMLKNVRPFDPNVPNELLVWRRSASIEKAPGAAEQSGLEEPVPAPNAIEQA